MSIYTNLWSKLIFLSNLASFIKLVVKFVQNFFTGLFYSYYKFDSRAIDEFNFVKNLDYRSSLVSEEFPKSNLYLVSFKAPKS